MHTPSMTPRQACAIGLEIGLALAALWPATALAKSCSVNAAGLAFGVYDTASASAVDSVGTVTIDCDGHFNAVLSVSKGNGTGASYWRGRQLTRTHAGGTLTYNLYANPGRTQVLGDGTGGSVTLKLSAHRTLTQPVWGRVIAGQGAALAGSYADVVMVTVSY